MTSAESKATYTEIKDYVLKEHGMLAGRFDDRCEPWEACFSRYGEVWRCEATELPKWEGKGDNGCVGALWDDIK